MDRSQWALGLALAGLISSASATNITPLMPALPAAGTTLAEILAQGAWNQPPVYGPGLPEHAPPVADAAGAKASFVLLDPQQPEPRNGDDNAWFTHAWQLHRDWEQIVIVSEIRELRTLAHPTYLAAMDAEEMGVPLEDPEPEAEPEAQAAVIESHAPRSAARFIPHVVVGLTFFVGLLGLIFLKPDRMTVATMK
jgi:hypothetical protein